MSEFTCQRAAERPEALRAALMPSEHRPTRDQARLQSRRGARRGQLGCERTSHQRLRAALFRIWRPWEKSTDPKTKEGKANVPAMPARAAHGGLAASAGAPTVGHRQQHLGAFVACPMGTGTKIRRGGHRALMRGHPISYNHGVTPNSNALMTGRSRRLSAYATLSRSTSR